MREKIINYSKTQNKANLNPTGMDHDTVIGRVGLQFRMIVIGIY